MFLNKFVFPFEQSIKKIFTTNRAKRKPNTNSTVGNLGAQVHSMAVPWPLWLNANEVSSFTQMTGAKKHKTDQLSHFRKRSFCLKIHSARILGIA